MTVVIFRCVCLLAYRMVVCPFVFARTELRQSCFTLGADYVQKM